MKLGRRHLIASLVILVASIAWNVWVFTQPDGAGTPGPLDPQVPLLGSSGIGGERPRPAAVDPMTIPPPPPLDLTKEPVWTRNPFAHAAQQPAITTPEPAAAAPVVANPVVGVILYSADGRHSAIIDGKTVVVGDRVQDAVVVAIARDAVIVQRQSGERVRLPLRSGGPGEP